VGSVPRWKLRRTVGCAISPIVCGCWWRHLGELRGHSRQSRGGQFRDL